MFFIRIKFLGLIKLFYFIIIFVALELPKELPEDDLLLDTWFAEPIKSVIVPADIFISNNKGYPVLPKPHQAFVKKLMHRVSYFIFSNKKKKRVVLLRKEKRNQEMFKSEFFFFAIINRCNHKLLSHYLK